MIPGKTQKIVYEGFDNEIFSVSQLFQEDFIIDYHQSGSSTFSQIVTVSLLFVTLETICIVNAIKVFKSLKMNTKSTFQTYYCF